jgi:hypothetical protein
MTARNTLFLPHRSWLRAPFNYAIREDLGQASFVWFLPPNAYLHLPASTISSQPDNTLAHTLRVHCRRSFANLGLNPNFHQAGVGQRSNHLTETLTAFGSSPPNAFLHLFVPTYFLGTTDCSDFDIYSHRHRHGTEVMDIRFDCNNGSTDSGPRLHPSLSLYAVSLYLLVCRWSSAATSPGSPSTPG